VFCCDFSKRSGDGDDDRRDGDRRDDDDETFGLVLRTCHRLPYNHHRSHRLPYSHCRRDDGDDETFCN